MERKIRGVVFDLFHTLIDPEIFRPKDYRRSHVVAEILDLDKERFSAFWRSTLQSRNTSRGKRNIEYVEDYLLSIGRSCSAEDLARAEFELGRYQDMAILHPPPGVATVLSELKRTGFTLCILSNCDDSDARAWPQSPLAQYFDATAFSCDTGYEKPAREAYLAALGKLGCPPDRAAYVGDGGNGELDGARDSGFRVVIFMRGNVAVDGLRTPEEIAQFEKSADRVIDLLEELPPFLRHL